MADDPNLRPSTSSIIATDGIGSGNPISIATRGFLSPILGDLVLGGEADVTFASNTITTGGEAGVTFTFVVNAVGGTLVTDGEATVTRGFIHVGDGTLTTGGEADVSQTRCYVGDGTLTTGGEAVVTTSITAVAGGDMTTGGEAAVRFSMCYVGEGTLITDGEAVVTQTRCYVGDGTLTTGGEADVSQTRCYVGDGTLTTGGEAVVDSDIKKGAAGRGGFFEYPHFGLGGMPIKKRDLTPMEYLRIIQKILADENEPTTFTHVASGGVGPVRGYARTTVILRHGDSVVAPVVTSSDDTLDDIEISVPSFFQNGGTTPEEIAAFEDRMLLAGSIANGDYNFSTGKKSRFIAKSVGEESPLRVGSTTEAAVTFVDRIKNQILEEDDMLLGMTKSHTQEEEELMLLGIDVRKNHFNK